jgi:hypothetical protein
MLMGMNHEVDLGQRRIMHHEGKFARIKGQEKELHEQSHKSEGR